MGNNPSPTRSPTAAPTSAYCSSGYGLASNEQNCYVCPAGEYSTGGYASCSSCSLGTYSPTSQSSSCSSAPAGIHMHFILNWFDVVAIVLLLLLMVVGGYVPSSGSSVYFTCNAGSYSTGGTSSCTSCPSGHYMPYTGQSFCYSAPSGLSIPWAVKICFVSMLILNLGHSFFCAGYSIPNAGTSGCCDNPCAVGYYSTGSATSCSSCAPGTYQASSGQSYCTSAPAGTVCFQS